MKPSDLLRPSVFTQFIKDTLFPWSEWTVGDQAVFGPCAGPHDTIYDIDYDDTYTIPEFIKKSKDFTKLYIEGVMN